MSIYNKYTIKQKSKMYSKIYSYILNNKFYHSTVDLNTFIVVIFIGKIHEIILYQPKNKKKS